MATANKVAAADGDVDALIASLINVSVVLAHLAAGSLNTSAKALRGGLAGPVRVSPSLLLSGHALANWPRLATLRPASTDGNMLAMTIVEERLDAIEARLTGIEFEVSETTSWIERRFTDVEGQLAALLAVVREEGS